MAKRARVTDEDRNVWASYLRLVRALPGRAAVEPIIEPLAQPPNIALAPPTPPAPRRRILQRLDYIAVDDQPAGLDGSSWARLRTGKIKPVRRLDLHTHTAEQAYYRLRAFLAQAHADRLRAVEVITGRGSGPEGGVLKRELPLWLNLPDVRPMILGAVHPHAANTGAVILLLRRPR